MPEDQALIDAVVERQMRFMDDWLNYCSTFNRKLETIFAEFDRIGFVVPKEAC